MKILTILNSLAMGGIEKTLSSSLPYLSKEDIDLHICCFSKGGELEKYFIDNGVKIHYIKKTGSLFFDAYQLLKIIKIEQFDIVHSRLSYTSGGFALAAKLARVPFLLSIHNQIPSTLISWSNKVILKNIRYLYLRLHKIISTPFSTFIIGHSQANLDANYPNWKNNAKYKIVYNGVDYEKLSFSLSNKVLVNDKLIITHIGSFRHQKNHLFLIECFKLLQPLKNNLKLVLIGDGPLRKEIIKSIDEKKLDDCVEMVGVTPNIGSYLQCSDLFFFPSLFEGLANVLMEAQFMNVPICASDIAPHYESVYKDYHTYFFDPNNVEDAVNALSKIINQIRINNLESTQLEAKDFVVQNFSIKKMAESLISVYRQAHLIYNNN